MSDTTRRLALVTTARSDYNLMQPLMSAAQADPRFDARIFVAAMHLLPRFGETWHLVEADGLPIHEKVPFLGEDDTRPALAAGLARGAGVFAEALGRQSPDIVVLLGDRIEMMPLAMATAALGLPLAHLCGGDITEGAFDDQIRHMLTKMAHLHFPAMPAHGQRIRQMGEESWRVHVVGSTALDGVRSFEPLDRRTLAKRLGAPDGPFALVLFHAETLGASDDVARFGNILAALETAPETPVLIYPNIDPGFDPLIVTIERFREVRADAIVARSLERAVFWSLMHHAAFMVGNSSSALWEAPSFGLPAVNIGWRQGGRVRGANVIDVSGDDGAEVAAALDRARGMRAGLSDCVNPYGDGRAAPRILDVLAEVPLGPDLLTKRFVDIDLD